MGTRVMDAPPPFSVAFRRLLDQHALAATLRQMRFSRMVGERRWNPDAERPETLRFDGGVEVPAQVLGFASSIDSTWVWSWAAPANGLPRSAISASWRLKELGEFREVPELCEAYRRLAAADIFVHILGTVAVGMLDAAGYYVASRDSNDVLLLVPNYAEQDTSLPTLTETASVFEELLLSVPINPRATLTAFLEAWQIPFETQGTNDVLATWPPLPGTEAAPRQLMAAFDKQDRLVKLTVTEHG